MGFAWLSSRSGFQAESEVGAEGLVEGVGGIGEDVVGVVAVGAVFDSFSEGLEFAEVGFSDFLGSGHEFGDIFEALEFDHAGEGEGEFEGVEDVEEDDLIAAKAEVLYAFENFVFIVEEVGDDDGDAFAADLGGGFVENGGDVGLIGGVEVGEDGHDVVDGGEVAGAGDIGLEGGVEDTDGDGVALVEDEVGEAGGEHFSVVEFGDGAGPVFHGLGAIEEDVGDVVGFLFVLFEVVAVGPSEDFPVEVAGIVAGDVFAVLGEFDGEAAEGGLVFAGHVAFDDEAGVEAEGFGVLDGLGVEEGGGGFGHF